MPPAPVPSSGHRPLGSGAAALLLDADGTLWDTRVAMEVGATAGLRAGWPGLLADEVARGATQFRADPGRFVCGELDFGAMRAARLRDVAEALDVPWSEGVVAAFESAYQPAFDAALTACPDAVRLLARCERDGIPVRVLTNSSQAYTQDKVRAAGLDVLAGRICARDCLGRGKPEAEVFHHACAQMGLDPGEVTYVGDEWRADALGAWEAGLRAIWLVRDDGDPAGEVAATVERREAARARGVAIIGTLDDVVLAAGPTSPQPVGSASAPGPAGAPTDR